MSENKTTKKLLNTVYMVVDIPATTMYNIDSIKIVFWLCSSLITISQKRGVMNGITQRQKRPCPASW